MGISTRPSIFLVRKILTLKVVDLSVVPQPCFTGVSFVWFSAGRHYMATIWSVLLGWKHVRLGLHPCSSHLWGYRKLQVTLCDELRGRHTKFSKHPKRVGVGGHSLQLEPFWGSQEGFRSRFL